MRVLPTSDSARTCTSGDTTEILPVIMATALDRSENTVAALRRGANDYVSKPFDLPVVLARVATQLELKRAMREAERLAQQLRVRNAFIRRTLGRYVSDEVAADLLENPEALSGRGEKRRISILMSDLRGFTTLTENLSPIDVLRILNNYLGKMTEVIQAHRGTIDEFIGDAILAMFGAPEKRPDDVRRAVACAVEMQLAMEPSPAALFVTNVPPRRSVDQCRGVDSQSGGLAWASSIRWGRRIAA